MADAKTDAPDVEKLGDHKWTHEETDEEFRTRHEAEAAARAEAQGGPSGAHVADTSVRKDMDSKGRVVSLKAQPVRPDNRTRRAASDALEGLFCKIVKGEHAGRVGVFLESLEHDDTGYPTKVLVRTRDEFNERLALNYKDIEPAGDYRGGR